MTTASSGARLRGPLYLDASAAAKLYLPESNSDALGRVLKNRRDVLLSDLAVTEIVSSLSRRRREGDIDRAVVLRIHNELLGHIEAGFYRRVELVPDVHRAAERLLLSVDDIALRVADALHVCLAVHAQAHSVATYDRRLAAAAEAVGLITYP